MRDIGELREALQARYIAPQLLPVYEAARDHLALLESDAIVISREVDGSWDITNEAFAVALEAGARAGAVSLMGLEAALLAYFDALAASAKATE